MKDHFHKVPIKFETSFSIRNDVSSNDDTSRHYHQELELHFVKRGCGLRFIGDNVSIFDTGEMILLGANLPHTWKSKDENFETSSAATIDAWIIHFMPNCLGDDFLELPESACLKRLFEVAKKGIVILGETKKKIAVLMEEAMGNVNLDRVISFIKILQILSESDEYENISSADKFRQSDQTEFYRINLVSSYTLSHYKQYISLQEVSKLSNMSVTSFCRYFKLITKKTYFEFLTEIRVSNACRLLTGNDMPIQRICEECGFHNAANFFRHFKNVVGITPMQYRRNHQVLKY